MQGLSCVFALAALICAAVVLTMAVIPGASIRLSYYIASVIGFFVCAVLFFILRFSSCEEESRKKKVANVTMICMFAFYIILLAETLIMGTVFANGTNFTLSYNKYWVRDALPNLVPFKSTVIFIRDFALGKVGKLHFVLNIIGNIILYIPFALFVPAFSKSMRRFDSFLPFIVFLVLGVEVVQGMLGLGTCATDDLILGVGSTCLVFFILKSEPISSFLTKNHVYR